MAVQVQPPKRTSAIQAAVNILRQTNPATTNTGQDDRSLPRETYRSTDEVLLKTIFLTNNTAEAQMEDMKKQLAVLQMAKRKIDELLPTPAEIELKEQMTKKITLLSYLTNLEMTFINNAKEFAMYPPGYAPPDLLTTRRTWLMQRAHYEKILEGPGMYIEDRKSEICGSETFATFVEEYEEIVFGEWPLSLPEVEWSFVEHP
ncbi:hypothetical protein GLAREA_07788 [Glarea lozoyensis ATCC 20868]|uniref:Uncharacterized protein n=1 Tax=Glarea lozoyensis (strain ATCC 20868 / MF5171) TaxID=1116229 RepID=S3D695_GLAL2|nr:uncharacterized protein GLAREA_07788 [Glarea lozoyensis ATCC 20868]EPE32654.1 hypothetical protein GLAREA_07788 [Glarea lozoyensis ATCC 20868]